MGNLLNLYWITLVDFPMTRTPKKKSRVKKGISEEEFIKIEMEGRKHGKTSHPFVAPTDPSKGEFPIGVALEDARAGELVSIRMTPGGVIPDFPKLKSKAPVKDEHLKMIVPQSLMLEILQEISNETEMGPVVDFGYDAREKLWSVITERLSPCDKKFPLVLRLSTKEELDNESSFRRTRRIKKKINERLGR